MKSTNPGGEPIGPSGTCPATLTIRNTVPSRGIIDIIWLGSSPSERGTPLGYRQ